MEPSECEQNYSVRKVTETYHGDVLKARWRPQRLKPRRWRAGRDEEGFIARLGMTEKGEEGGAR
jgi:hypothetical protein